MQVFRGSDIAYEPASHEDPSKPGVLKRVLASRNAFQSGHVQMLNWALLPAGHSFQLHYHEDMQEAFIIVRGNVQMRVDDHEVELSVGDAILIAPCERHSMHNASAEDAEYIVFGITSDRGGKTVVVQ